MEVGDKVVFTLGAFEKSWDLSTGGPPDGSVGTLVYDDEYYCLVQFDGWTGGHSGLKDWAEKCDESVDKWWVFEEELAVVFSEEKP